MADTEKDIATLGGGCFWCLEAVFQEVDGVEEIVSGYAGGHVRNPSYREVTSGTTGHAEVVRLTYDRQVISYRDLLEIFFSIHDPTTLNRQGADVGPQYRSIILYHSDEQRRIAGEVIADLQEQEIWDDPIITEVEPASEFYPAEQYHRDYYRRHPDQAYCKIVIDPKMAKFRRQHLDKVRRGRAAQ
ncbi:MAG: peptide-methionine (S)-S-oxide reductase MsrA [Bacteroidota bacterium]